MSDYHYPHSQSDDHRQPPHHSHIKPSERFARPSNYFDSNGAFLSDSKKENSYSYTNHPAFTYTYKQPSSFSSSEESPSSTWSSTRTHDIGNSTSPGTSHISPPTSIEDGDNGIHGMPTPTTFIPPYAKEQYHPKSNTSINAREGSIYDAFAPSLPPKTKAALNTDTSMPMIGSNDQQQAHINSDTEGMKIALLLQEELESRDKLTNLYSPLPTSPRKLVYNDHNCIPTSSPIPNEEKKETIPSEGTKVTSSNVEKSPRRKSFFTLGNGGKGTSNVGGKANAFLTKNAWDNDTGVFQEQQKKDKNKNKNKQQEMKAKHIRSHSADSTFQHFTGAVDQDTLIAHCTNTPIFSPSIPQQSQIQTQHRSEDNDQEKEKRSSRLLGRGILGRRSKSASRTPSSPPSSSSMRNFNPYKGKRHINEAKMQTNGMVAALEDDWTVIPPVPNDADAISTRNGIQKKSDSFDKNNVESLLPPPLPTSKAHTNQANQAVFPKTPSPVKSRQKALSPFGGNRSFGTPPKGVPFSNSNNNGMITPPSTVSPPSIHYASPPVSLSNGKNASGRDNVKSPPFFLRGRESRKQSSGSNASPGGPHSTSFPNRHGIPVAPPTPPISPPAAIQGPKYEAPTKAVIASWPAEAVVFGAAQQALGKATIGPHVPQFRESSNHPSASNKVAINLPELKDDNTNREASSRSKIDNVHEEEDVFGPSTKNIAGTGIGTPPLDPRKRINDLLRIPQSRKSSLYTSSSGSSTPIPRNSTHLNTSITDASDAVSLSYLRKPKIEEAILSHPKTILASILDNLSYRSFKRLTLASPKLYRATSPINDKENYDFTEVVRQRYLACYGYRSLSPHIRSPISFTLKDLHYFNIGMEYSLSEYAIFATEHKRLPLDPSTTKLFRESTRSFNKLVFRLQIHSQIPKIVTSLIKPYWKEYTKIDQGTVFKPGRCAMLRVWVPCESIWMKDEEIIEVEREIHRSGVWNLMKRGDLVRNIALGDIANEGLLIFDGKYLRDLAFTYDTIGHLPSWVNSLVFSPSYFHNQIASSTHLPVVYLDLSPFQASIQQNLLLCKEKVDLSSPSGEQYKVTRYVYRTVVDLVPSAILNGNTNDTGNTLENSNDRNKGKAAKHPNEVLHPDWAGQLIIETDGTTEAAKALLQRVKPISRDITPDQPRPPAHVNNKPYRIVRNLSRPGLIFCRVVEDTPPLQSFR